MDLLTHTAARSTLATKNGRAIDEPSELKNLIVNSNLGPQCRNRLPTCQWRIAFAILVA
jgi:hypothetical protein